MTGLMSGGAKPRTRPGDYERCLELMAAIGGDKGTRKYLEELRDAQAAHDKARTAAEAAEKTAAEREQLAHEAELDAKSQRDALQTETEQADSRLRVERGRQATERQRLQEWADNLTATALDLQERENSLKAAFRSYTGE